MVLLTERNVGYRNSKKSAYHKNQRTDRKIMKQYRMRIEGIEKHVLRNMNKLRKENGRKHCDVVLISQNKFYAHKIVLSSCSEYLRRRFEESGAERRKNKPLTENDVSFGSANGDVSANFEEMACSGNIRNNRSFVPREKRKKEDASKEIVILPGIPPELLAIVLDYMYTSELVLGSKNVNEILFVGCLLQVDSVIDLCAKVLLKQPDWRSPLLSLESLKYATKCSEIKEKLPPKKGNLKRPLAPTTVTWATGGIRPSSSTRCVSDKNGEKITQRDISVNTAGEEKRSNKEKAKRLWSEPTVSPSRGNRKEALTVRGLSFDSFQISHTMMSDSCTKALQRDGDLSTSHPSRYNGDFRTGSIERRERTGQDRAKRRRISSDVNELQKINPDELKKEILHSLANFKTDLPYYRDFSLDKESSCGIDRGKQPELDPRFHPILSDFNASKRKIENPMKTKNPNSGIRSAHTSMQEKAKSGRRSEGGQGGKRNARKKRTRCTSEVGNTSGSLLGQDGLNCLKKPDRKHVCVTPPANFRSSSSGTGQAENPMSGFGFPVQHVIRTDYAPFLHYYPHSPHLYTGTYDMTGIQKRDDRQNCFMKTVEARSDMQQPITGGSQGLTHNPPNPHSVFVPHFDNKIHTPVALLPNRWNNYTGTLMAIYTSNNNPPNLLTPRTVLDNDPGLGAGRHNAGYIQPEVTQDASKYYIGRKERGRWNTEQDLGRVDDSFSKVGYGPWLKRTRPDLVTGTAGFPVTDEVASEQLSGDVVSDKSTLNLDGSSSCFDKACTVASVPEKKSRIAWDKERERNAETRKTNEALRNLQTSSNKGTNEKSEKKRTRKYTEYHRIKRKLLSAAPEPTNTSGEGENKEECHPNVAQDPPQAVKYSSTDDITTRDCLDVSDPESDDSGRPSSV